MYRTIVFVLATLFFATPVFAEEPGGGAGGGEEKFDVEAALKEVSRLMTEAESLLVKALKPGGSAEAAGEAAGQVKEAIDKLLTQSGQNGQQAVDKMTEILEKAPQGSGQGQGQEQQQPDPKDAEKAKDQQQKVDERDPKNSGGQEPKSGEKQDGKPDPSTKKPPEAGKDKPAEPDPNADWLANLPEKVRQAYLNGEWEVIPAKWRELIEQYTKKVATSDR